MPLNKQTKKFEKLEEKFNIANDLVHELSIAVEEVGMPAVYEGEVLPPAVIIEEDVKIFEMEGLKSDFILIRSNILKLINNGQRILDTASVVDVSDLSAKHLEALASLQQTIGNNLKLMIDCYKQIADIEKLRQKENKFKGGETLGGQTAGTIVNNQILFNGDTSALLDLIKQNQ